MKVFQCTCTVRTVIMRAVALYLFILALANTGFTAFLGKYTSRIESIRDLSKIPRDSVDWKFYVKKINRKEQMFDGYMIVKKKIGPLELTINIEKWMDGGFKKFLIDGMTTDNVCTAKEYKVIMENFNGTINPDCIFMPGAWYLKPFNIDTEMHKHVQDIVYGKFRVTMIFHSKHKDIMGFQVVIIYEKLK